MSDVPVGFHVVHVQCPRCHDVLDVTIPNRHFQTWEDVVAGKVVTCDESNGCGLQYFARPILPQGLV